MLGDPDGLAAVAMLCHDRPQFPDLRGKRNIRRIWPRIWMEGHRVEVRRGPGGVKRLDECVRASAGESANDYLHVRRGGAYLLRRDAEGLRVGRRIGVWPEGGDVLLVPDLGGLDAPRVMFREGADEGAPAVGMVLDGALPLRRRTDDWQHLYPVPLRAVHDLVIARPVERSVWLLLDGAPVEVAANPAKPRLAHHCERPLAPRPLGTRHMGAGAERGRGGVPVARASAFSREGRACRGRQCNSCKCKLHCSSLGLLTTNHYLIVMTVPGS